MKQRRGKERRESTAILRRAMIESGIPYRCEVCQCDPVWQGLPLTLEIDHIDGDWSNNERLNVRFLCPNCHTQTRNYGSRAHGKLYEEKLDEVYMWSEDEDLLDHISAQVAELGDALRSDRSGRP